MDALIVLAALMVLAAIFLPYMMRPRRARRSPQVQCINNLKQIGLAYRIWEGDNGDTYPMFVPQTNGGTMGFTTGANAWRHFQVMSNELSTPKLLICPVESDPQRFVATNFDWLSNSNLSFFVGIVTNEVNPFMILSGDHNLTNGSAVKNGQLELTAAQPLGWTAQMHNSVGNIGLADGSVQHGVASVGVGLRNLVASTGVVTNLIQMPVLGP